MAAVAKPNPQPVGLARWTPSLPVNLMGMINPFGTSSDDATSTENKRATPEAHKHNPPSFLKRPLPTTVQQASHHPPSPSRSSASMFAEPESRSSDAGSREGSVDERRAKRSTRPKTQFSICHPPPESKTRQKLHRRPRSLLQLHKLCASARPQPALEVIPSANFSVQVTRAVTRAFKAKHRLCPNDLLILKAEKYSSEPVDEDQDAQDVIGLICKNRSQDDKNTGKLRIYTASGTEWEAYPAVNGGHEFFSTDEHGLGLTVRWVPKRNKDGSKSKNGRRRFNFSTISPNCRRHPVIATLSSTGLDINDTYKIPELSSVTPLSSPKLNSSIMEDDFDDENSGNTECETDEKLRELITLTAIFVAFKEGWSPSFKFDEEKDGVGVSASPPKSRSMSISTLPPGSPTPFPMEKRNSINSVASGIIRRTSKISKSNRSSTASVRGEEKPEEGRNRSASVSKTGRARADSSSTVLVHRAASNRRKNNSQPWRPDVLPAQDPLQETSKEDSPRDSSAPIDGLAAVAPIANNTAQPKKSIAQPLTPDDTGSGAESTVPRSRIPVDRLEHMDGHRESTTTSDTSASSSPAKKAVAPRPVQKVKKSGWRRLLCIA